MCIRYRTPLRPPTRWDESDRVAAEAVLAAFAADGFAIHRQRMQQQLGVRAVRVRALPVLGGMADQGAVTVRSAGQALATVVTHGPFLTSWRPETPLPRRDSLISAAMTSSTTVPSDTVGTQVCPACGAAVPTGTFCGCCGAELAEPPSYWRTVLRPRVYAAAPQEKLALPMVTSSLFPHLERPSRSPFQAGLVVLVLALIGCTWLRLIGPLISVAGLGVPLLFVLYLWQTDVYRDMPRHGLLVSAILGTALGVGWTLFTGGVVARAYGIPIAAGFALEQVLSVGLAISLVGAFLMIVPAIVVRMLRPPRRESLDGFVIGAMGALAFTAASTITNFAPQFVSGLINDVPTFRLAVHAALYGLVAPLTAGASGGLIGIALWFRPGARSRARRWRMRAALLFFTLLVAGLYSCIWIMEATRMPQSVQLLLHIVLAMVALIALRAAIQMALLREAQDPPTGQPILCVHCDRVVPDMPFCPSCGAAARASSRFSRQLRRQSPPVRSGADPDGSV